MNCLEEASKSDVKQENLSEPVVATKKEPESEQVKTVNDQAKKKEDDGAMLFVKNLNFKTGKFQYYNYSINFTTERDRKKSFRKFFRIMFHLLQAFRNPLRQIVFQNSTGNTLF